MTKALKLCLFIASVLLLIQNAVSDQNGKKAKEKEEPQINDNQAKIDTSRQPESTKPCEKVKRSLLRLKEDIKNKYTDFKKDTIYEIGVQNRVAAEDKEEGKTKEKEEPQINDNQAKMDTSRQPESKKTGEKIKQSLLRVNEDIKNKYTDFKKDTIYEIGVQKRVAAEDKEEGKKPGFLSKHVPEKIMNTIVSPAKAGFNVIVGDVASKSTQWKERVKKEKDQLNKPDAKPNPEKGFIPKIVEKPAALGYATVQVIKNDAKNIFHHYWDDKEKSMDNNKEDNKEKKESKEKQVSE